MNLFRLIWRHLGPDRWRFGTGLALTFLEGLLSAAPAALAAVAIVLIAGDGLTPAAALLIGTGVPAALLARLGLLVVVRRVAFPAGTIAGESLRLELLERMVAAPLSPLRRWPPARLATLLTDDAYWVNEAGRLTLFALGSGLAAALALLGAMIMMAPMVGSGVLVAIGAGFSAFAWTDGVTRRALSRRGAIVTQANARIGEYAGGIAVFRSFGRTGMALEGLSEALTALRDEGNRSLLPFATSMQLGRIVIDCGMMAGLALVAWQVERGDVMLEGLALATMVGFGATGLLVGAVAGQLVRYRAADRAEREIARFLAEPLDDAPGATKGPTGFAVTFECVAFSYDAARGPAVSGISFSVQEGGLVAIVGRSGSGKSTLARLLASESRPSQGWIGIGGAALEAIAPDEARRLTTLVSQDVVLFRDTLRANILMGDPQAAAARLDEVIAAAALGDLIAALPQGLDTVLGDGGRTLSGGERQRVALARALLKPAPILILDEATSALDPTTEREICERLLRRGGRQSRIVIAHRLATIRHADEILVMEAGRIVERGDHAGLLARGGTYARLWHRQEQASGWRLRAGENE